MDYNSHHYFYYQRKQPADTGETCLSELDLPLRLLHFLEKSNIHTAEELLGLSESELLNIQDVGKKTRSYLRGVMLDYLDKKGLERTFPRMETEIDPLRVYPAGQCKNDLFSEALKKSIGNIGISKKLQDELEANGLTTIDQLVVLTEHEIKSISKTVRKQYLGLISRARLYLIENEIDLIFPAQLPKTTAGTVLEQVSSNQTAKEEI